MTKNIRISFPEGVRLDQNICVAGSKSQSNRLLLLDAVLGGGLDISNLSNSDDTAAMMAVLNSKESVIDIHHAGTAMRFGTAFLASREGRDVILTGSKRMKERPIHPLVDALRALGADISYMENQGYPPLAIRGGVIKGGQCEIDGGISSQFITALLLCAPRFEMGLSLKLKGNVVSLPYIGMTVELLKEVGVDCSMESNVIEIKHFPNGLTKQITVESDWSSASYFFSLCACSRTGMSMESFREESLQGDSALLGIYEIFGVRSDFDGERLRLEPIDGFSTPRFITLNMGNTPDIAQTVAVTMAFLGIKGKLTGLGTLRVKETDRIAAMSAELAKFGVETLCGDDSLEIVGFGVAEKHITLNTYNDHRMAMAFAVMGLKYEFVVEDYMVVSKSYVNFWEDWRKLCH